MSADLDFYNDADAAIYTNSGSVILDLREKWGEGLGRAEVILLPEEAVQLSRALVKAAAEALGVESRG